MTQHDGQDDPNAHRHDEKHGNIMQQQGEAVSEGPEQAERQSLGATFDLRIARAIFDALPELHANARKCTESKTCEKSTNEPAGAVYQSFSEKDKKAGLPGEKERRHHCVRNMER